MQRSGRCGIMTSRSVERATWSVSIRRRCGANVRPIEPWRHHWFAPNGEAGDPQGNGQDRREAAAVRLSPDRHPAWAQAFTINHKKLYRLYCEEGLAFRRRPGRKRARGSRSPMPQALCPNQRWSMDFVSDTFGASRRFREHCIRDEAHFAMSLQDCWSNPGKHGRVARPGDGPSRRSAGRRGRGGWKPAGRGRRGLSGSDGGEDG
jgi:hypothetical protein